MKLRLTAKGDQVFNLDARYDSLKEALEGQRYTEGENGGTERELGELLMLKGKTIATAESCTGGNIAAQLTSIAGSSAYFRGSIVAYANDVKERVLGVRPESLEQFGAVSEPVVRQMAEGARRLVRDGLCRFYFRNCRADWRYGREADWNRVDRGCRTGKNDCPQVRVLVYP